MINGVEECWGNVQGRNCLGKNHGGMPRENVRGEKILHSLKDMHAKLYLDSGGSESEFVELLVLPPMS